MPKFDELNLLPENPPAVDLGNLPEQRAGEYYLPQPGDYIWTLPEDLSDIYTTIATDDGQRVQANFKGAKSLKAHTGDRLMTQISNRTFKDAKTGVYYSDFAYLLNALGYEGSLRDNGQYITALSGEGGKQFKAELVWTGSDRATGQKFGQRGFKYTKGPKAGTEVIAIPKIGGKFLDEFQHDGSSIRVFGNLRNFRPV